MEKTRSAFKCPLFGCIVDIKDNYLPTYEDVMKFYEWTRHQLKLQLETAKEPTFSQVADIVVPRIEGIWQTASIPTVTRTRIIQMLKAYHLKCKNLLKSIKKISPEKLESFRENGKLLFDIASCKCKELPHCICPTDKKVPKQEQPFLIDQRTSRNMFIGKIDITTTNKLQKTLKRKLDRENSTSKSLSNSFMSVDTEINVSMISPTSPTSERSSSTVDEFRNTTDDGVPEIKRRKISHINLPTLSNTCDRYGVSDRAAAAIASSVLHDIGSDLEVIDRHKLRRERSKNRQKLVKEVINTELSALYFDGKKDKTFKMVKKGNKYYRTTCIEEHISVIQEPGSIYMGYVVPVQVQQRQ